MCLLIGPSGVGKTVLMKRLQTCSGKGTFDNLGDIPATIPTVGTNMANLLITKKSELTVRELGGCMGPLWHRYFKDVGLVMFMIDLDNRLQLSMACIQLLTVLHHEDLINVPLLIILNKIDLPTAMSQSELESSLRFENIIEKASQQITIQETSTWNGQGLEDVVQWMYKNSKSK